MAHISLLRLTRKNHSKRTHNNEVQSQHRCSRNRLRNRQPSNGGRCSCTRRQRALCSSRQACRFQRRPTGCMYVFLLKFSLDNVPNETPTACGSGTTISCSPSPGNPCKGNFSPAQASIVVTKAAGNCHVSLYTESNQGGSATERLNTDTTGTCVFTSAATWKSYGVFCD